MHSHPNTYIYYSTSSVTLGSATERITPVADTFPASDSLAALPKRHPPAWRQLPMDTAAGAGLGSARCV
eukprot:CAMPEP_0202863500 /NCGR_PEP_ID=MMETSP1391-20130828/4118_1 /ASSEMBLY_ACC=CAM_ASM_000867 /TAXON_ID=1034604 /ORGANISM="Chlamydomonas leiostraca, Strain SAG 11-49" /LENGTH=68 /DNA_ID=CAMNT_0049543145 /DNA_START=41 /DNA_END=247 /DNA_ORIENTATION=+